LKVKAAYGDRRRTQIVSLKEGAKSGKALTTRDLMPKQTVWIGVTADGVVARTHDEKEPRHSGNDAPRWLVKATTSDTVFFVSKLGKAAAVAAHLIPESDKLGQGVPYYRVSPLSDTDVLAAVFSLPASKSELGEETCVLTVSRYGMVKKTLTSELPGPSSQTFTLARVNEGDVLLSVGLTDGRKKEILLVTAQGMGIRFKEDDVRPMGLVAAGVNGIKLDDKDEVTGMEILPAEGEIFLLTSDGKAKRIEEKEFPVQGRYGKGVIVWDLPEKVRVAGAASGKPNHMAAIFLTKGAPKSTRLDAAGIRKRAATKGDEVVEVKPGEGITALSVGWSVERFVEGEKKEEKKRKEGKRKEASKAKKAAPKKVVAKKKTKAPAKRVPAKKPAKKKLAPKKPSKPAKKKKK
jgi:DNA gyrase subunit A